MLFPFCDKPYLHILVLLKLLLDIILYNLFFVIAIFLYLYEKLLYIFFYYECILIIRSEK